MNLLSTIPRTEPAERLALALAWSGNHGLVPNKPGLRTRKSAGRAFHQTKMHTKTSSKLLLSPATPTRPVRARLAAPLPAGTDDMILALPGVRRQMTAQARALVCELVPLLLKRGLSQNAVAAHLGIQPSSLSTWLKAYRAGGMAALVPKTGGRGQRQHDNLILLNLLQ